MNWCVVIPTYNNEKTLEKVVNEVLLSTSDIIVVNDGSTDNTSKILESFPRLRILNYDGNRGKGYALKKGFELAIRNGFKYAITIDSDGQHYAKDIAAFVAKMEEVPDAMIIGSRILPKERLRKGSNFANRFSNFWFRLITGIDLPDTQSGFRLYPLHLLQNMHFYSRRYEFELEVLVRAAWKHIKIRSIPVSVFYPSPGDRISHYRPIRDFLRISLLYTILVFLALFYVKPFSFLRYLKKDNIHEFFRKHILFNRQSTVKITLSVMLGVFMGLAPIWGYQLITAIALAYLFKLNKVLVIVAANISIPPLIPLILYLSFVTGNFVLGTGNHIGITYPITFDFMKTNLWLYIVGSIMLALVVSLLIGISMFIILKVIRRKHFNTI